MTHTDESDNTVALHMSWDLKALGGLWDQLDALSESRAWSPALKNKTMLVLEELLVNAITYGGQRPETGFLEVVLREQPAYLLMDIRDNGEAFDPFSLPVPDIEADLDSRPIGGLGVFLTKALSSSFYYERKEGLNHVHLCIQTQD
jgi:serine/threonine-protein kinase RsbW